METWGITITIFCGVLGLLFVAYELRLRRILFMQNFDFQKEQFEEEKLDRIERSDFLRQETLRITQVSELLASKIAVQLKDDADWAFQALNRAKLIPHANTLYADRLGHFIDEKESLADHFIPLLLKRCKAHIDSNKKVILVIDSGTTLSPIFDRLGRAGVRCYENNEEWIKNLTIVTNNLAGVEALFQSGLVNPGHRYSSLAVNCLLLPGIPLPIYSAVTGKVTDDAIIELKKKSSNKTVFITLTTGNWIRLRRTSPVCPVPLARGIGHLSFKQALIENSNEIFVITPLSKIFANSSQKGVNSALNFSEGNRDTDKQAYDEVDISDKIAGTVKIVTTYRTSGRVLSEFSTRLKGILQLDDEFVNQFPSEPILKLPHIAFPFDKLQENSYLQIETEFPHPHTRHPEFMEKFFFVSQSSN
ncbi:MAG: hypothetical protein HN757_18115 [Calditrichaeota bacterium]|jgi:hypothetical protein|nr:hypothetical protein [Calditrichota bacterium]